MSPLLVATALIVVAGAVVAVSAHDGRTAVLGLAVSLALAPLLASPLPDGLGLAARIVGAILAAFLIWASVTTSRASSRGSILGWPVEAVFASVAVAVGYGISGAVVGLAGPATAMSAGVALMALAVLPLSVSGDPLRLGIGCLDGVLGALLVRGAIAGTAAPLENLVAAVLLVGIAAAAGAAIVAGPEPARVPSPAAGPAHVHGRQPAAGATAGAGHRQTALDDLLVGALDGRSDATTDAVAPAPPIASDPP